MDNLYGQARRAFGVFVASALSGALIFFVAENSATRNWILLVIFCVGLASMFTTLILTSRAIGRDSQVSDEEAARLRMKLLLFGPLGVLDILLSKRGLRSNR